MTRQMHGCVNQVETCHSVDIPCRHAVEHPIYDDCTTEASECPACTPVKPMKEADKILNPKGGE